MLTSGLYTRLYCNFIILFLLHQVATEPPISVNSDSDCKESSMYEKRKKNGAKLSEAKSSSLIRRWTVGERVLIQPRRPIMDAPEIVPLNLHSSVKLGKRPKHLNMLSNFNISNMKLTSYFNQNLESCLENLTAKILLQQLLSMAILLR